MAIIVGTPASETIVGTRSADTLFGLEGDDLLYGKAGNDTLVGGEGESDLLFGGAGNDTLDGGYGETDTASFADAPAAVTASLATGTATGGGGSDQLIAIEYLTGSSYDDVLTGDGYHNQLSGRDGDDQLVGGAGSDYLIGGRGFDTLEGGADFDTAGYEGLSAPVIVDLAAGTASVLQFDEADTLSGIEAVIAGNGDDSVAGDGQRNILEGRYGDDRLYGRAGDDTLYGGYGDDTLSGTGGLDSLWGSAGNDVLAGGAGDDQLRGEGSFLLDGSAGSDRLDGGTGADVLDGGEGNDVLLAGAGDDVSTGGTTTAFGYTNIDTFRASYVLSGGRPRFGYDEEFYVDFKRGQDRFGIDVTGTALGMPYSWDGDDVFDLLDSDNNGVLGNADADVAVRSVFHNGVAKLSTVIDFTYTTGTGRDQVAHTDTFTFWGTTGLTAADFW